MTEIMTLWIQAAKNQFSLHGRPPFLRQTAELCHLGEPQSQAAAPPRREVPVEVVWASD